MGKPTIHKPQPDDGWIYFKSYKHHISGKIIRAEDYGLKAFRIPRRRRNGG